jgi:hypothetical protein
MWHESWNVTFDGTPSPEILKLPSAIFSATTSL